MLRVFCGTLALFLAASTARAADASKWTVKAATTEPPKEVAEPIRKLLGENTLQVLDGEGKLVCEFWLRKEVPVKATPEEIEKGISYRKVEQSTVIGAIHFAREWVDYRKQTVKSGIYTLRLGYQPEDGNHQGTAPYTDFLLLAPAADDRKVDLLTAKALQELSKKTITDGDHPSVMMLVPKASAEDAPKIYGVKMHNIAVLSFKQPIANGAKKGALGFGVTVFGVTMAE